MSTLLKKAKDFASVIVAVLLTVGMMSFNMITSAESLEWHERQSDGTYVLIPGSPSAEPSNGCTKAETELCAKGFTPGQAPAMITDATLAVDRFTKN